MPRLAGLSKQGKPTLTRDLYPLAISDAQRPNSSGAGLNILEALLKLPSFRPTDGGQA